MADDVDRPVQCPVCAKEFQPADINKHLDKCLTENDCPNSSSAAVDEPPSKKSRVSNEFFPSSSAVTSAGSGLKSNRTAPMFSVFQHKQKMPGLASKPNTYSNVTSKSTNRNTSDVDENEEHKGSGGSRSSNTESNGALTSTDTKSSLAMNASTLLYGTKPLAEKLRPNSLEEYFGQNKVLGEHTLLRSLLHSQEIPSLILWGPPGCGKVTAELCVFQLQALTYAARSYFL